MDRQKPKEVANAFINLHFPNCTAALLAGSVVRGEETTTSDLDIVIFDRNLSSSYRQSVVYAGWPIEVFVHSLTSYKQFFKSDCERAIPSMPRMVSEGIPLKNNKMIVKVKEEANELLMKGPKKWSTETIIIKRYFLTDLLDDFKGCLNPTEGIFIAQAISIALSEFVLRVNQKWLGHSKWVYRALRNYDVDLANDFVEAFAEYYKTDKKEKIIELVENILHPYGGTLFQGFSIGKE